MTEKRGRKRKISDLELAFLVAKGMNQTEIAEKLGVARVTVRGAMKRMREECPELLEEMSTEDFRKGESDDLANLRRIVLYSLRRKMNTMSLASISLQQLGVLYGIMFEKDRLLRGEATEHIAAATYQQLDSKTLAVIGDAVKTLTKGMLVDSRAQALEVGGTIVSGDSATTTAPDNLFENTNSGG
jgi:transposase